MMKRTPAPPTPFVKAATSRPAQKYVVQTGDENKSTAVAKYPIVETLKLANLGLRPFKIPLSK
jgi:hypothetical protein